MNSGTVENPVELKTQDDLNKLASDVQENIKELAPRQYTLLIIGDVGHLSQQTSGTSLLMERGK